MINNKKVVIVGDGAVGSSTAFTLLFKDYINEIAIIDLNTDKVEGDVLDMVHGMSFVSYKKVKVGTYKDIQDAHVLVITAGVGQKPGETRLDLLKRNMKVFDSILEETKKYMNDELVVLVVTNPVDILTYYTYKKLGIDKNRVIGSGTVLDTARLKYLISSTINVDPKNVHGFVIGEHGDSEVCAFSISSVSGIPIKDYLLDAGYDVNEELQTFSRYTKNAAYEIISKKGSTYYAIALSVERIIDTILNDKNSILTVSIYIENDFNGQIKDVYLSLPAIVGSKGVVKTLHPEYSYDEVLNLIDSYKTLKKEYKLLNL